MSTLKVELEFAGRTHATIEAELTEIGADNIDTWSWKWSTDIAGNTMVMDEGFIQHRESDGAFALLHNIISKTRGHTSEIKRLARNERV